MPQILIEARTQTTREEKLQLGLNAGVPDAAVTVNARIMPSASANVDSNGWPIDFIEKIFGSIPELERPPQGDFEQRMPLGF
jgi:hypothetical protein